jgi:tetratricopeptide (TPR) repeat protein
MQKNRFFTTISIAILSFLSLACSGTLAVAQTSPKPAVAESAKPAELTEPVVNSPLNAETFYKILLAELNLLDEEPRIAFALILDSARKTKEDALFERAVTIALQARSGESALSAARAWLVAKPTSLDAARYMAQISISMNRLEQPDGKADLAIALQVAKIALTTNPADADAAQLAVTMMATKEPMAEQLVKQYLESKTSKPKPEVRLAYSRALVTDARFAQAKAQVQKLSVEAPTFAAGWLVLGTLQYQESQEIVEKQGITAGSKASNDAAEVSLKKYIQLTDSLPPAQRAASQQRAYVLLANMAKTNKQYQQAYDILNKIIASNTLNKDDAELTQADLQYDLAMMAEKLNKLDDMERILRLVIAAKPQDPQAYNALGYSLADRNVRLPEAKALIQQAVKLAPQDPFIADSLGWVEFKMGNLAEAQRVLEAAYKTKPDAEIAAHLGEVLWKQGLKDRATAVWKEGVSINKSNDTLVETLKRFGVKLNAQP